MKDTGSVLIVGAGAIGRGFIAPVLSEQGYKIHFADNDDCLVSLFQDRNIKTYVTAFSSPEGYDFKKIHYGWCYHIDRLDFDHTPPRFVVFAVGMKNLIDAATKVAAAFSGGPYPGAIYTVENDPASVEMLNEVFNEVAPVYFGVPDVITSNEAPERLEKLDPLCLCSEVGELYLEGNCLHGEVTGYDDDYVRTHWICKKYLHNTPHAALAYCGAVRGHRYIHEAAADFQIGKIVESLMSGIQEVLEQKYQIDGVFLKEYAAKEISRFRNAALHDPISRVGRNPDIKLKPEERIVHIAELFLEYQIDLTSFGKLISDALDYPLCEALETDRAKMTFPALLEKYTGLAPESPIGREVLAQRKVPSQPEPIS
ncbi:hypothetical protein GUA87_05380 [Sneathiella sp. P13V-1]|uniref:mannitol dehydrogenase family protein n=1 Tax=Sneathiella sp. P13V-1 TaxID=2697366 RepID=UPI00187B7DC7|nr:hypothetical protein [Sneathiella sp. P13V-1]MBE7636266.1 hypothetical protein [Sneathiella sp. P13V-1]